MDYRRLEKVINKQAFRRQRYYLPDARTIFDVGAFVGQTVHGYRKLYPEAQIYAFEPAPLSFDYLCSRFAGAAENIITCRVAVSNWNGTDTLHVNEPGYETSLLEMTDSYRATGIEPIKDIRVTTIALDRFCRLQNIDRIDVLKMDVQGNELRVLQGAWGLFDRDCVGLVFAEMCFWEQYQDQCWWYEVGAWLAAYGFDLVELAPQWRQSRVHHANGLFAKDVAA